MDDKNDEVSQASGQGTATPEADRVRSLLARGSLGAGRVGTYTLLGAAAGTVPVPWVPDALTRRVRGALVQDVVARYSLSLTPEARNVLSEPAGTEGPRGLIAQMTRYMTGTLLARFGPLGLVPPVRSALATFVLGHLFHRYVSVSRTDRSVRIDVVEARRVRQAIDRAMLHAFAGEVHAEGEEGGAPPDDMRDQTTQLTDSLLIALAGLPSFLVRRLDAAFDDLLPRVSG
jgi:hypothetical protein